MPDTIRGIHPVQLSPAKVWIVAGEGQGDGKGKMIYPETGGNGALDTDWRFDFGILGLRRAQNGATDVATHRHVPPFDKKRLPLLSCTKVQWTMEAKVGQ